MRINKIYVRTTVDQQILVGQTDPQESIAVSAEGGRKLAEALLLAANLLDRNGQISIELEMKTP